MQNYGLILDKNRNFVNLPAPSLTMEPEKTMEADKQALLNDINTVLREKGLRAVAKLGDHTQGEIEITGVKDWLDHNRRFYTDVVFKIMFPGGVPGFFPVRFNANSTKSDGAIMVPIINGLFAIVRQWRATLGRYTWELPRGFSEKMDEAQAQASLGTLKISDLPLGTLTRELGEEVMASGRVIAVTHLGNVAENTGTHNVIPAVFMAMLELPENQLPAPRDQEIAKVELWTPRQVTAAIGQELMDLHTLGALMLATKHLNSLPKLG